MTAPALPSGLLSKVLLVIAAVCFFFAALTVAGSDILNGPAWAWGFGGFSAWALAWAVP